MSTPSPVGIARALRASLAAVIAAACAAPAPGARADLVLVAPDTAPAAVCYQETTNKRDRDRKTAESLARYLSTISGQTFTAAGVAEPPADRAILVGRIVGELPEDPGGDGYLIRVTDTQLHIAGHTTRGTAIGAYAFLEERLGCRWWSHDEEDVPTSETVRLEPEETLVKPVFIQTDLMNNEAKSTRGDFAFKCRGVSTEKFTSGHSLYKYLTPYADLNNEFYPYNPKTGKRAGNKLHFCYTAPGIAEALFEALDKEVQRRKGNVRDFIYQAGMGDWYGGTCQCERCKEVYAAEKWIRPDGKVRDAPSSTLIQMINRAAELLEEKYPGVRVGTFAYMTLEGPPGKTMPRDNVVIWVPHLRHCIIHAASECGKNATYFANVKRWCEIAPGNVYIWDYGVNYGENFTYPFPVLRAMGENIRTYGKLGVEGVRVQGNYVSTGGDLVVLKNWVWGKLLWNPALQVDDLVRTFCEGYYGPAADEIAEYVLTLEDLAASSKTHMNEFARRAHMQNVYLGADPGKRFRNAVGKKPAAVYGDEAAALLEPMLAANLAQATEDECRELAQPILDADLAAICGGPLAAKLRKFGANARKEAQAGKDGAAYLKRALGKRAKRTYGAEVVARLAPLLAGDMAKAGVEQWDEKLALLETDDFRLACGRFRAEKLRGVLASAIRSVHVWRTSRGYRPLFERALAKAAGQEPYERRVREAEVSLEAIDLWHDGPLVVRDGRFLRLDIGGGEETWPRVAKMLANSRKASAKEWSSYQSYHKKLMRAHGGPLATLTNEVLTVQVAPWLRGRVRKIAFRGHDLLRLPDAKEAGYPNLAGATLGVSTYFSTAELQGEPTATHVDIVAGAEGKYNPLHSVRTTVDLLDDGVIRITGATLRKGGAKQTHCSPATEYAVGKGSNAVAPTVEAQVSNAWRRLEFAEREPQPEPGPGAKKKKKAAPPPGLVAKLPDGARALRLTLPSAACVVEDRYVAPAVVRGSVRYDRDNGVLVTRVSTAPVPLETKTETVWLTREIRIKDLETAGEAPGE